MALYDAAEAITALMQADGYRIPNRPGAHHAVGLYAEATLASERPLSMSGRSTGCGSCERR